jgi:hypothetical protein
MQRLRTFFPLNADFLALEANAEQARRALACSYSSSDEFEAAIIASRREEGRYGCTWCRQFVAGVALIATLAAATLLFV